MGILNMNKKVKDVIVEEVYSPIDDPKIKSNISGSEIWKTCYKKEDITDDVLSKHNKMYLYTIKFDGVTPFQVTKIKAIK